MKRTGSCSGSVAISQSSIPLARSDGESASSQAASTSGNSENSSPGRSSFQIHQHSQRIAYTPRKRSGSQNGLSAGGPFSAGGDSGSLIVDAVTGQPVALLFAGGLGQTFANPIDPILARFKVEIL